MVVHGRRGERAVVLLDDVLRLPWFEMVPPGRDEMEAAYAAFVAFGRGSGHPAALNFGDLFSYALAKVRGLPLLFKRNDFAQTDIVTALATP
jgi:ribonuclease VapC